VADLLSSKRNVKVITIGGDQLTGKSTLCKDLIKHMGATTSSDPTTPLRHVTFVSAGVVFRQEAARRGLSVGELSKLAISDTSIDVAIEYETCKAIMGGIHQLGTAEPEAAIVVEGRNPAVMARYCAEVLDKTDINAIYLSCSPRIQARRFIGREFGNRDFSLKLDALLADGEYPTLRSVGEALLGLDPAAVGALLADCGDQRPSFDDIIKQFMLNEARDEDDRRRYLQAYAFPPELDYRHRQLYDLVVDTSAHAPADSLREVVRDGRFGI
jgi:cytidylate kinase